MRDTRCPECGLKSYYFKTTTCEFVCKKCGTTWIKQEAESGGRQITYADVMKWVDQAE
jgi:ribosomal protein S27E